MTRLESFGVALGSVLALMPACTDPTTHVLVGNAFDPSGVCLLPSEGFDLVDGREPGGVCPPTCVVDARTGTTYVTTTCPPYPPLDTIELPDASTGASDPCPVALSAWSAGAACGLDAGLAGDGTDDDAHANVRDGASDRSLGVADGATD